MMSKTIRPRLFDTEVERDVSIELQFHFKTVCFSVATNQLPPALHLWEKNQIQSIGGVKLWRNRIWSCLLIAFGNDNSIICYTKHCAH
jgi:hypothetical protein